MSHEIDSVIGYLLDASVRLGATDEPELKKAMRESAACLAELADSKLGPMCRWQAMLGYKGSQELGRNHRTLVVRSFIVHFLSRSRDRKELCQEAMGQCYALGPFLGRPEDWEVVDLHQVNDG